MKKVYRLNTMIVLLLMLSLSITMIPDMFVRYSKAANDYGLENPKVAYLTRDIVEFGHYWQEDTNGDGKADINDQKTPIRWQVLERNGDELLLLSDKVLDVQLYHSKNEAVTWEACTLRSWLNNDFYNAAFSSVEKSGIKEKNISNPDNPIYGTDGGNNTKDRVFLLSLDDIKDYGFKSDYNYKDQARYGMITDYSKKTSWTPDSTCEYLLRSPGQSSQNISYIDFHGSVQYSGSVSVLCGVRPVLYISLSNLSEYVKDVGKENVALKAVSWDTVVFGAYEGSLLTWRVLNVNGDDAFLMSDKTVAKKPINNVHADVTWESCTLRTWLNNDFYNNAFSSLQKQAIKSTTVLNYNNPYYGTSSGNNTVDRIYILSGRESKNADYGFPNGYYCSSDTRVAVSIEGETSPWWLRTCGVDGTANEFVRETGFVHLGGSFNDSSNIPNMGVRPVLHINLASSAWTKGEKVTAGDVTALITPTPTPSSSPKPTVTPTSSPTPTPTASPTPTPTASPTVAPTAPPTSAPTSAPTATPVMNSTEQPTQEPTEEPEITPTATPEIIPTEKPVIVSESPVPTPGNNAVDNPASNQTSESNTDYTADQESIKKGIKFFAGNLQYKVVSAKNNQYEVYVVKVKNKKVKAITIDSIVVYKGNNFKITGIGKRFASGCTKLKKINIKSKYIKKIEKKAFAGIKSKYKILVVKSKLKKYAAMIKKAK